MKTIICAAMLLLTQLSWGNAYIGIGSFQSEFAGSEFDRKYESDVNDIRQINFGYNNKEYLEIFGGVNIDENDEVRDFALGLVLEDKIVRVESGKISGTIVDDDGPIIGSFDNDYKRLDIFQNTPDNLGFFMGVGIQQYAVPHLFEFNDGSIQGPMLQDDQLAFTSIGLGIYYEPIYNYLMSDETGFKSDWYFATSALAISLAYAENSDAPDLVARDMNGQSWLMWGNSGTYELGWLWGYKNHFVSAVFNVGYHIRANTFFNLNPVEFFADEADEGDINLSSHQTIMHGLVAAVSVSF
ncbi:hypothetical protein QNI23_011050 [Bermanella sp. WJH001]|uniref:hypothetical protein n=1 Tax=Bermanella sp. WJH001 TaxID=3048005 RepID=UPI0024BD8727|nr:hypothetical protein [Bermanella sp. WJH001]MDJ1537530.1 hypothetical protein [Bermanella sp. WJH001]